MVPLGIKASERELEVASFEEADFHLLDVYPGINIEGDVHTRYDTDVVFTKCVYMARLDLTATYISRHEPLHVQGRSVLLRISRIQYGPDLFPYGPVSRQEVLQYVLHVTKKSSQNVPLTRLATLKSWFDGSTEPPVCKVSSRHLRHVTIKELRSIGLDVFRRDVPFVLPLLESLAKLDLHESFLAGLLVWAKALPVQHREIIKDSLIWQWRYKSVADFFSQVKNQFSGRLKAVQNLVDLDLTPFFELEVLVNRGLGEVDWNSEVKNRTEPNTVSFTREMIFERALRLFKRVKVSGGTPTRSTWVNHWAMRWQWSPTGAYHSQYPEDDEFKAKDVGLRNKFYALSRMPTYDIEHFLDRPPSMEAWSSTKYEWGKQRAIYGVDVTNFILSSYAFKGCEEMLSKHFPIGPSATIANVRETVKQVLNNGIPYCFDFEDFNSQHSVTTMSAVMDAYVACFKNYLDDDQIKAIAWVQSSLSDSKLHVQGRKQLVKTNGTLLSGWRLTTFMNTVLNYVYLDICGITNDSVTTHNGDDVLASIKTLNQVQNLSRKAADYNIRFQKHKCYLGATAEFLRVDHRQASGGQYLSRSVATLVHGPTETVVPNDVVALITSLTTRRDEVIERGGEPLFIKDVYDMQLSYLADVWGLCKEDLVIVENTHISKGGLSQEVSNETLAHSIKRKYLKREKREKAKEDEEKPLPGTYAYASLIARKYKIEEHKDKIIRATRKAVLEKSTNYRFGVSVVKQTPDMVDWIRANQYGMLRDRIDTTQAQLAKAYNIPLLTMTGHDASVARYLSSEGNMLEALAVMA